MERQLLDIVGISTSNLQTNTFALILEVKGTHRRIPIIIGPYEAQAIAVAMEGIDLSRPLTHDLMKNIITSFELTLVEVYINKFNEGVFYSTLLFFDGRKNVSIDSRTSDAVAMAVRFNCPVYASDSVIEATAMEEEDAEELIDTDLPVENEEISLADLELYLQELIEQENYEEASKVRDEIKKRKNLK